MSRGERKVTIETVNNEGVTVAFDKYSDRSFQRRRSRKKSIDVMAMQQALQEMGVKVSPVEIFGVLKDYRCPTGMFGQIHYEEFLVVLGNARNKFQKNPTLTAAFRSLGGDSGIGSGVPVANVLRSLQKLKQFNVDVEKLETVCSLKSETDTIDFNEFAACFE
eukprot:640314_1